MKSSLSTLPCLIIGRLESRSLRKLQTKTFTQKIQQRRALDRFGPDAVCVRDGQLGAAQNVAHVFRRQLRRDILRKWRLRMS